MNGRISNPLTASLVGLVISFVPAILWYEILNSDFTGFLGSADDHAAPLIISSILTLVVMAYVLPLIAGAKRWRKAGRVFLLILAALLVVALLFEEDLLAPMGIFVLFLCWVFHI